MPYVRPVDPKVVSRRDARMLGLTYYYTGNPCISGHVSERYVSNGMCRDCHVSFLSKKRDTRHGRILHGNAQIWSRIRRRIEVLTAYSKNGVPECACCGETTISFLTVDHVNGGGNKHRRESSPELYHWFKANGYPPGYQVLCFNCNWSKHAQGVCSHELLSARSVRYNIPNEIENLRPFLSKFIEAMTDKLSKNSHKDTPSKVDVPGVIAMLRAEIIEFEDQYDRDKRDDNALLELADIANFALLAYVGLCGEDIPTATPIPWIPPTCPHGYASERYCPVCITK